MTSRRIRLISAVVISTWYFPNAATSKYLFNRCSEGRRIISLLQDNPRDLSVTFNIPNRKHQRKLASSLPYLQPEKLVITISKHKAKLTFNISKFLTYQPLASNNPSTCEILCIWQLCSVTLTAYYYHHWYKSSTSGLLCSSPLHFNS